MPSQNNVEAEIALARLGFARAGASAHCSRTLMLAELSTLLDAVPDALAPRKNYQFCVERENCLGKPTSSSRKISFGKLALLYGLDPKLPLFGALRYLWAREEASRPLLALLCASCRDPLLSYAAPFILERKKGEEAGSAGLTAFLEKKYAGRLSMATLGSASRNIRSTFTQSGHLQGRSLKTRVYVKAGPASVAYALYLAHLEGLRGRLLFEGSHMRLLDCGFGQAWELARGAAQNGWLILKRIDEIIEIDFPNFPQA